MAQLDYNNYVYQNFVKFDIIGYTIITPHAHACAAGVKYNHVWCR